MPITIIGPSAADFPSDATTPMIELKRDWSDSWAYVPELRLVRAVVSSASHGLSEATVKAPYGSIKHLWELDFGVRASSHLRGWWLRVRLADRRGLVTAFVGRISTETRTIYGADVARSGEQQWTAYGPLQILRKIHVSRAFWLDKSDPLLNVERELGWVPGINFADEAGRLVGNRTSTVYQEGPAPSPDDVHLYTITPNRFLWTHYDYVRYLVKKFVSEDGTAGPKWSIGGQVDALKDLQSIIPTRETQTVAALLAELIPPRLGLDYVIRHTADGFELEIFCLVGEEFSFADSTLKKNPNQVRVEVGETKDSPQTLVEETDDFRFDRIRVIGRRAIVCFSLGGSSSTIDGITNTLEPKWDTLSPLLSEYAAGTGDPWDLPEAHDRARHDEKFKNLWAVFGAPADWDQQAAGVAVTFTDEGEFDLVAFAAEGTLGDYQLGIRKTLSWIPLREGFDYSVDPSWEYNPESYTPDFQSPQAWISDPTWNIPGEDPTYRPADACDVSVSPLENDWGVFLRAPINHLLAIGDFYTGSGAGTSAQSGPSDVRPRYDWRFTVCTIAIETDQRIAAECTIPGGDPIASDGVMEVFDNEVQAWIVAPNTVIGLDEEGRLKTSGEDHHVLRCDHERLALVMCGALARYFKARARAEITIVGLRPWQGLIGHILQAVEQAGDTSQIRSPITSVEWIVPDDGEATTIIRAGFALEG